MTLLGIILSILFTVLVLGLVRVIYNYVLRGGQRQCDGQPYDTIDSEEWYAKCGKVAPHSPHTFKEYNEEG